MTIREYLQKTTKIMEFLPGMAIMELRPQIECADGFKMSVQASGNHYCSPRENLSDGNYDEVEIGYPTEMEDLIIDYAENPEEPTETVYAYVPVNIVDLVIEKHGGIKE